MSHRIIIYGGFFGLLTVAIGAFGAHALQQVLEENGRMDTFQTAIDYQAFHALALMMVGVLCAKVDSQLFNYAAYSFVAGILLFSGSLYYLSLTNLTYVARITPFGGLLFIVGWVFILVAVYRDKAIKEL